MLLILLQNIVDEYIGLIVIGSMIASLFLLFLSFNYYDGLNDEPVKIKNKRLRLGNYYDKYVIEKFYFPGFWSRVLKKPFVVPEYVTEVTPDMSNIYDSNGNIISRVTMFPETDDYELAKKEFDRINAYVTKDRYRKYVLNKPIIKKSKDVSQNEKPVEASESSKKIKRKNTK